MSKVKQLLTTIADDSLNFCWEDLLELYKDYQFPVLVSEFPIQPPIRLMSSVTSGVMYPMRDNNILKKE